MKKIPPELDSLMWTLAENGNDRAIEEFGLRHPQFRTELLHRMNMVKGLRGAKSKVAEPEKVIPRFIPKENRAIPRIQLYVVGGLLLAAVGALAFVTTTLLTPPPHVVVQPIVSQPPHTIVEQAPVVPQNVPVEPPLKLKPIEEQSSQPDLESKPGDVKIDHAPLLAVLDLIGQTCGVDVAPAPGMPNPDVFVNYKGMTAMEMLKDLGTKYGFTPLDQHDGSIIVVPAVDQGPSAFPNNLGPTVNRQKIGG